MATPKQVSIKYIRDEPKFKDEKPYRLVDISPDDAEGVPVTNLEFETIPTMLQDLRKEQANFRLDRDGFQYLSYHVATELSTERTTMLPFCDEMIKIISHMIRADRYLCYDLRMRDNTPSDRERLCGPLTGPGLPFQSAHVDHTRHGGWERVKHHLTRAEQEIYLDGSWRIRIYNIWKPLLPVIEDTPFAICDPATVDERDLWCVDLVGPEVTGENYYVRPNQGQHWYWIPRQTEDELLLFLNWDSHAPIGTATGCPHSAFIDPDVHDAPPRKSVEARVIAFTKLTNDVP